MILEHNIPYFLWPDPVAYACYLKNRSPTQALKELITPEEAFKEKSLIFQYFKNLELNAGSFNKMAKTPNLIQNPKNLSLLAYQIMAKLGDTKTLTHTRFRYPGT